MSLIKCPECGKEVSNTALTCPNCGYSINQINQQPVIVPSPPNTPTPSRKKKHSYGCLTIMVGLLIVFAAIATVMSLTMDNATSTNKKSVLAKELDLTTEQENKMTAIFQSCGIGEIVSATKFQGDETHTSYHLSDAETSFYKGVDYAIVIWVTNETKSIEAIYFHDYDIYVDGEVIGQITDYYVNKENRDKYRVSAQMAILEILQQPDTAKFPAISGWAFGVDEGISIVQSSVTAKNALGAEITSKFQAKFNGEGNIISLILDGTEYIN